MVPIQHIRNVARRCGAPGWPISLIAVGAALRVLRTGMPVDVAVYRQLGRIKSSI
jgi:hypothetical protein